MFLTLLPLRAIFSQILILWVAIAIESWLFQKLLNLSPKNSVEYAASINLYSSCLGWFIFFCLERVLPEDPRRILIAYMLLGRLNSVSITLTLVALTIFCISFLLKWQGFAFLQLLSEQSQTSEAKPQLNPQNYQAAKRFRPPSTRSGVILIAHTSSHLFILLTLVLIRRAYL